MKLVDDMIARAKRWVAAPAEEMTRLQRWGRYLLELTLHCSRELRADKAGQMAAALTYHTLFSILPTLALMLVAMRIFVTDAQLDQFKNETVDYLMQWLADAAPASENEQTLTVDNQGSAATDGEGSKPIQFAADPETQAAVTEAGENAQEGSQAGNTNDPDTQNDFATIAKNLRDNIQVWLNKLQNISFRSIGIVGVLLFIYGATGLLATIERSFNQIYGAPSNRPWYVRLPMYYTVITLGPLVIVLGQYIQSQYLGAIIPGGGDGDTANDWMNALNGAMAGLTPVIATWAVLFAMYVLMPNTRVGVRAASIGSFVAAIGWVTTVELFGFYVKGAAAKTLYGALALLPLFLLWLWLTWLIILFGLELTYTLHMMKGKRFKSREERLLEEGTVIDPRWLIPLMGMVGERFDQGKPATVGELAKRMRLPIRAVNELGEELHKAELLHRVDREGEEATFVLAQPPDRIELSHILDVAGSLIASDPTQSRKVPGSAAIQRATEAQQQALEGQTLANVLNRRKNGARPDEDQEPALPS